MFNPYREIRDSLLSRKTSAPCTRGAVARSWAAWALFGLVTSLWLLGVNTYDSSRPFYFFFPDNFLDLLIISLREMAIVAPFLVGFVVSHEAGHVIIAALFKKAPLYLRIGKGPDVDTGIRVLGIPIRAGLFPLEGRAEFGGRVVGMAKWKLRAISIAGPLATVAFLLTVWCIRTAFIPTESDTMFKAVLCCLAVLPLIPARGSDLYIFVTGETPPMDLREVAHEEGPKLIDGVILRGYNMRFKSEGEWKAKLKPVATDADLSDCDVMAYYRRGADGKFREFYGHSVPPGVTIYEEVEMDEAKSG